MVNTAENNNNSEQEVICEGSKECVVIDSTPPPSNETNSKTSVEEISGSVRMEETTSEGSSPSENSLPLTEPVTPSPSSEENIAVSSNNAMEPKDEECLKRKISDTNDVVVYIKGKDILEDTHQDKKVKAAEE